MYKLPIILVIAAVVTIVNAEHFEHGTSFDHHYQPLEEHSFESVNFEGHSYPQESGEPEEHEYPKSYNFDYTVHDPHQDNYQSHQQSSDGGVVKGYYSVKEADGSLREVHYTADKFNGFKAIVTKNGVQVDPPSHGSDHSQQLSHHL